MTATRSVAVKAPRVASVLVAVVLSLALVVVPKGQRADAVPIAPVVGGAIAAAPTAGSGAAVGGLCATGVGCLALGAVALGITLYATHDTWMPWVKGALNFDREGSAFGSATGCTITMGTPALTSGGASVGYSSSGCGVYNGSGMVYNFQLGLASIKCVR